MTEHADHPLAGRVAGDVFTHRADHTGALAAGNKRQLRLKLVLALNNQHIGEVESRGLDIDADLIGARLGLGPVVHQFQLVRHPVLFAN